MEQTKWTFLYWLVHHTGKLYSRLFLKMKVIGTENLLETEPSLIVSNHASYLDPPLISYAFTRPIVFLARKTLFKGWLKPIIENLNAFPVDQENPEMSSLKGMIRRIREGARVLVFPEGTRTETGEMKEGQAGVGLIAAKCRAKIQPVYIHGSYEAWPKGGKYRLHPITVVIGEAFDLPDELKNSKSKDVYQKVSDLMVEKIAGLKEQIPSP